VPLLTSEFLAGEATLPASYYDYYVQGDEKLFPRRGLARHPITEDPAFDA
jgi:hypothetical protein